MRTEQATKTEETTATEEAKEERGTPFSPRLSWVVSYPKSGNTWMRLVSRVYSVGRPDLQGLGRAGDLTLRHYHNVAPLPISQMGLAGEIQLRPAAMFDLAVELHPQDQLVKSHNACVSYQGIDLWHPRWTETVLYIVRDPRDVACSVADHMGLTHSEAVEFMNDDRVIGEPEGLHHFLTTWSTHVDSWLAATEQDFWNVYPIRYEDMQESPVDVFRDAIDAVISEEVDEDRLREAVEKCEFDRLQRLEEEHGFPEQSAEHDRFFRKGESGGWRDELDGDLARKIVDDHGEMMERLDYV